MNHDQFQDIWLTDIQAVKRNRSNAGDTAQWNSNESAVLADFIIEASADIIAELGWLPLPYIDTLSFDYSNQYVSRDARQLWVSGTPLLEVTTLTNGDTSTISSSNYVLNPNNRYPKTAVYLTGYGAGCPIFKPKSSGQWQQAITIAGVWGYVPHYERCWKDTGQTVQDNPLSSSATTLTMTSTTGFYQGQYLKLSNETIFVSAVIDGTQLTIERGMLGTTATEHVQDIAIYRYQQFSAIERACVEWAAYLYKTKDQLGDQVEVYDNGLTISQGLPRTVYRALMKHQRVGIVSAS